MKGAIHACRNLIKAIEDLREKACCIVESDGNDKSKVTLADEDAIMNHIMDCITLLRAVQCENLPVAGSPRMCRNKVFMGAVSTLGNTLLMSDKYDPSTLANPGVNKLLGAFPVYGDVDIFFSQNMRNGWLPMHWAVVLACSEQYDVTETDIKTLYASDPMAMQSLHVLEEEDDDDEDDEDEVEVEDRITGGCTPAHLLCTYPATPYIMRLIRSFSMCNPTAFGTKTTCSALHVACRYGTPTVELLQHLLQLDSSQTKRRVSFEHFDGHYPLAQLCYNLIGRVEELSNGEDLMKCLLDVESSVDVVGSAVLGCIDSYNEIEEWKEKMQRNSRLRGLVRMLLKANPEAAKFRDSVGTNILHFLCWRPLPPNLCIGIIKMVLFHHKDAVQEAHDDGYLPVHRAATNSDVKVLEFLLGLYPDAVSVVVSSHAQNLLHLAILMNTSSTVSKVRYLCSQCPAMMLQRDDQGRLPVHMFADSRRYEVLHALYEAGGVEQFRTPIAHPTDDSYYLNGNLPIHQFVMSQKIFLSPTSPRADVFRWLMRLCPNAGGIEGVRMGHHNVTLYQMSVFVLVCM